MATVPLRRFYRPRSSPGKPGASLGAVSEQYDVRPLTVPLPQAKDENPVALRVRYEYQDHSDPTLEQVLLTKMDGRI